MQIRPKVLITKIGLDGHDRGSCRGLARRGDGGRLHAALAGDRDSREARHRGRRRCDIVPDEDETALRGCGVARVFHPGASLEEITASVRELAAKARAARAIS